MILVTGASGHIGGRIAQLLAERGLSTRQLVREAGKAKELAGSSVAIGDYADRTALRAAMEGVETVFLASAGAPPLKRAGLHGNVIDMAVEAGVKRLVYLSFQAASAASPFPYSADHLLSEAHLKQSGLDWTILRDSFYQDLIPDLADANGVIKSPGGNGKVAWVAREDVAQVAAAVLADDSHAGKTYDITGPEAFSLREAVARLAALSNGRFRYEQETLEEGRAWRMATGAPEWEVDVWLGSYLAMGTGELAATSNAVRTITGRDPMPLEANPVLLSSC